MKYWTGDNPIEKKRDLVGEVERLPDSDVLTKEDQLAFGRLLTHIMQNGVKLTEKEEWEWMTCGILKEGYQKGKKRLCIDLFWLDENGEEEEENDLDIKLAIMLKDRKLRCVPDAEGKFVFQTNMSYEEYLAESEKKKNYNA